MDSLGWNSEYWSPGNLKVGVPGGRTPRQIRLAQKKSLATTAGLQSWLGKKTNQPGSSRYSNIRNDFKTEKLDYLRRYW